MSDNDQIKALAELNGWSRQMVEDGYRFGNPKEPQIVERWVSPSGYHSHRCPDYLTSRDTIIPLVEKVINSQELAEKFLDALTMDKDRYNDEAEWKGMIAVLMLPANQFAEALLRATNKWKETP